LEKLFPALRLPAAVFLGADPNEAVESMLREKKETPKGYLCRFNDHETIEQAETIRGGIHFLLNNAIYPRLKVKNTMLLNWKGCPF